MNYRMVWKICLIAVLAPMDSVMGIFTPLPAVLRVAARIGLQNPWPLTLVDIALSWLIFAFVAKIIWRYEGPGPLKGPRRMWRALTAEHRSNMRRMANLDAWEATLAPDDRAEYLAEVARLEVWVRR